jgi:hypothetical protein
MVISEYFFCSFYDMLGAKSIWDIQGYADYETEFKVRFY